MNKELNATTFPTGDFISENAVRGALKRRAIDQTARRTRSSRPLRRWSVAELIARAVPRPPAGGIAH